VLKSGLSASCDDVCDAAMESNLKRCFGGDFFLLSGDDCVTRYVAFGVTVLSPLCRA
jgi:hypothetical protein